MKKYSKKNGYYKYYNAKGLECRIKVSKKASCLKDGTFVIKFKRPQDDEFLWTFPKKFKDVFEVINHILRNLETNKTIFKIESVK